MVQLVLADDHKDSDPQKRGVNHSGVKGGGGGGRGVGGRRVGWGDIQGTFVLPLCAFRYSAARPLRALVVDHSSVLSK